MLNRILPSNVGFTMDATEVGSTVGDNSWGGLFHNENIVDADMTKVWITQLMFC